jgi:uncharacterized protein YecT (DUF1311 family)
VKASYFSIFLSTVFYSCSALASMKCDGIEDQAKKAECAAQQAAHQDQALASAYQAALAKLPDADAQDNRRQQSQLVKSQQAWEKYIDANCALIGALEGGNNRWASEFAADCEAQAIAERIKFLNEITKP